MDFKREPNGARTFFEHWGLTLSAIVCLLLAEAGMFFLNLTGMPWIYFFAATSVFSFLGAGLIVYAKIPAYRSGRFLTFGIKSVPVNLAGYYRWGWRIFLFGVVLSFCLLLSKHQ